MTHYYISFVVAGRRSEPALMTGPDGFDVAAEYAKFRERVISLVGPQPSFLEPKGMWVLREMEILKEFQREYYCCGDFDSVFLAHLSQRHGFEQLDCEEVRLCGS